MGPTAVALLAVVSLITSALSAIVGMAGGTVLLSVLLLFCDPLVALPLHGVIQLVSNGSRALVQWRDIHWGIAARYSVLLLPMGFLGLAVLQSLPPDAAQALIGLFVLVATWAPHWLLIGTHPERLALGRRFVLLGGVVGLLNTVIGATGPLIAPFFLNLGLDRRELIGTKATCQTLGHFAKLVVFGASGFAFAAWAVPLSLWCLAGVAGTWAGSSILERVSEETFVRLYKIAITAVSLRLVFWDGAAALGLR